jgi:hypothetical protein
MKLHENQVRLPHVSFTNLTKKSNDILSWAVHTGSLSTSVFLIYICAYNIAGEQKKYHFISFYYLLFYYL